MTKNICNFSLIFLLLISGTSFSLETGKKPIGEPLQYSFKLSRQFWEYARAGNFNEMVNFFLNNEKLVGINYISVALGGSESVSAGDFVINAEDAETTSFLNSFGACLTYSKYIYFNFINSIIKGDIPSGLPKYFEKYINFIWQGLTALDWTILFGDENMARYIISLNVSARTCMFSEDDFAEGFPELWKEISSKSPKQSSKDSIESKYANLKKELRKQKNINKKQIVLLDKQFKDNYYCVICMDEGKFVSLPCGHVAGKICAEKLTVCPKCRAPFNKKRLRDIYF